MKMELETIMMEDEGAPADVRLCFSLARWIKKYDRVQQVPVNTTWINISLCKSNNNYDCHKQYSYNFNSDCEEIYIYI